MTEQHPTPDFASDDVAGHMHRDDDAMHRDDDAMHRDDDVEGHSRRRGADDDTDDDTEGHARHF